MKRFLILRKERRSEKGVALIAVVLTVSLVVGLIAIALTNSMVGQLVATTQVNEKTILECAQGELELANQLLVLGTRDAQALLALNIKGVVMDATQVGGDDNNLNNLVEEMGGNIALASDDLATSPDITINDPNVPACSTQVDVDFLFHHVGEGEEVQDLTKYHSATGGAACGEGDFYSITALTTGTSLRTANTISKVRSAFYKCAS